MKKYQGVVNEEFLRSLVEYDPGTGLMLWKRRDISTFARAQNGISWNDRYAGTPAFAVRMVNGYMGGTIFKCHCYAHRVAWAIFHGYWPSECVDHINRDRTDNRIANLRLASMSENSRNGTVHIDSTTGFKGVYLNKESGKPYSAKIYVKGRALRLGNYDTPLQAHKAYLKAAKREFGIFATGGGRSEKA